MKIIGLDHIQIAIPTGREDEARSFYAGVLGLTEVSKPESLAGRGGVWFGYGKLKVHLGIDPNFTPAEKAHPGFEVEDLIEVRTCLENKGFTVIEGSSLEHFSRIFTNDPFGNRIEFLQRHSGD